MSDSARAVILGGHGKIALLTAPKLKKAGYVVDSVIRNPQQSSDVEAAGATPVVLDIETADTQALADVFSGAEARNGKNTSLAKEVTNECHSEEARAQCAAGESDEERGLSRVREDWTGGAGGGHEADLPVPAAVEVPQGQG